MQLAVEKIAIQFKKIEVNLNNREKNRFEMIGKVRDFGDEEKNKFTEVPTILALFSDIKMIHREMELNIDITKEGIKGKVNSKNDSQAEIIPIGLTIAGGIYAYADSKSDSELCSFYDLSQRSFDRLRDSEVPVLVERILDKADELGELVVPFGITAADRTEARQKLNDHLKKYTSLNTGKGAKKTARKVIILLFKKSDKKLKVLDKLMLKYKSKDSALHSRYEAARVIYDKAGAHRLSNGTSAAPVQPAA